MVLLALTGLGQEKDRQKSEDAGFNGHLVKPASYAALTKLLAELPPAGVPQLDQTDSGLSDEGNSS
jgi:CheY-like chemotaxis protein